MITTEQIMNEAKLLPPGLYNGRIGICIYLTNADRSAASSLLHGTLKDITALHGNIDLREGLTGIVLALRYLQHKNVFTGNLDLITNETDSLAFRTLAFDNKTDSMSLIELAQYIYYETWRLGGVAGIDIEGKYLCSELIKRLTDKLFLAMNSSVLIEPMVYSLDYALPQVLFALSRVCRCGIYCRRIAKMIDEFAPLILYKMPILHANRLLVLWALKKLLHECRLGNDWNDYCKMITDHVSVKRILEEEVNNSIYLENGASSIYFLLKDLPEIEYDRKQYTGKILDILNNSKELENLEGNEKYLQSHLGLYNGYSGVELAKLIIERENGKI